MRSVTTNMVFMRYPDGVQIAPVLTRRPILMILVDLDGGWQVSFQMTPSDGQWRVETTLENKLYISNIYPSPVEWKEKWDRLPFGASEVMQEAIVSINRVLRDRAYMPFETMRTSS